MEFDDIFIKQLCVMFGFFCNDKKLFYGLTDLFALMK